MRPVSPSIGFPERVVAENQLEYSPIPVAAVPHDDGSRSLVTRWRLTPDEITALQRGEDLYLSQLNFGGPMTPLNASVGAPYRSPTDGAA